MTITDIVNKTYFYSNTNSAMYSAANMLIAINNAYERVTGLILQADGRWQFGDTNYSALPTGTQTMVAGTQTYTFNSAQLNVLRVEVKDAGGLWYELEPISLNDIEGAQPEFYKTNGLPLYYEKRENFILLYPAPAAADVTLTNGLNVYFQRTADLFTSAQVTTGTKSPGFNSLYHDLLPLWAAYDYAVGNALPNANQLMATIQLKEKALILDYSLREQDAPTRMTTKPISGGFR